jgi:hypothetical protein
MVSEMMNHLMHHMMSGTILGTGLRMLDGMAGAMEH